MSGDPRTGGPLAGLRVIELAGIGPAPLCCSLLSDMGAEVLTIDRPAASGLGLPSDRRFQVTRRGRPSLAVNLKDPKGAETVRKLVAKADALVDPFRPGVMEGLGLGPEECLARNQRLVYGRMTGWGQTGPVAPYAGHDLNYLALTGMLSAMGPKGRPMPPLNLVADMGGGAMFLAFGLVAALLEARGSGKGQVVDVSMTEGAAYLASGIYAMRASDRWSNEREDNFLDGGAPFYGCYETKDGGFVSIAPIEPKFYAILLEKLEIDPASLPPQFDKSGWPAMQERFTEAFKQKTRDEWVAIMQETDICFAPVLDIDEAPSHPHNQARGSFVDLDGVPQPVPAPRFSRTPGNIQGPVPELGAGGEDVLPDWGFTADEITALKSDNVIGRAT